MKKNFYLILLFTGIIASTFNSLYAQEWLDADWTYRRIVTITNPGSTVLTDFQVEINLDNTFDFVHANSDGSDIRLTAADGTTLLPFWIEEWNVAGTTATIWVKVPTLPVAGLDVYLYYGNPAPVITPGDPVETPPSGPYTKNPTKIIPIGVPVGRTNLLAENIVFDNVTGHYWMVLTDQTSGATVCLVYSDDPTNPSAWYWGGAVISNAIAPHIMEHNGTWYIFYGDRSVASPYPVSVATSSSVSGPYTKIAEVLQAGAPTTWEDARADEPYVFQRNDGKWILMYMGDAGGNVEQVGYAEADDILGPYTKFAGNPCIPFGLPGTFDAGTVADPWVYEYYGVYYIGYTVSPTTSSPWQTALATTTDWTTFTKQGILLPLGGEYYSFRGAVTRIGNEYVFSYAGGASAGAYRLSIATQPVFQAPPSIINNGDAVFDFFDGFDGTSIDLSKWSFQSGTSAQTIVGGGLITMNATATYVRINGNAQFGMDYIGETRGRHPDALTSGRIVEYGFAAAGGYDLRITDNFPTFNRWQRYVGTSVTNFGPAPDVNWHVLGLYRQSPGTAGFKIDNTVETVSTGVPTSDLSPFLMSYGNPNQFIVDWTRVRKWAGADAVSTVGAQENSNFPIVEHFDYQSGQTLRTVGAVNGWQAFGGTANNLLVVSGNLTYADNNYPMPPTGNQVQISNTFTDDDILVFEPQSGDGTKVYSSFLLNVTNSTGLNSSGSNFLFLGTGINDGAVLRSRIGSGANYNIGLSRRDAGPFTYSGDLDVGTTYLIVFSYEFVEGSSNNDIVNLWINPLLNGIVPPPTISVSGTVVDNTLISGLIIRQATGIPNAYIDGLRIGTTWSDTPLPVELSSFSAATIGSTVKLNWRTETEVNNFGFNIERSVISNEERNLSWEKIGFVNGNGNSNSPKDYSFEDNTVNPGRYSYRLKQIDNDGQFEYSKIIEVDLGAPKKFELSQNYPNPFNPATTIRFSLPESGIAKLTLYNVLGQEIKTLLNENKETGVYTINFDASELNSGVYIYKLESGSFVQTRKMILLK